MNVRVDSRDIQRSSALESQVVARIRALSLEPDELQRSRARRRRTAALPRSGG